MRTLTIGLLTTTLATFAGCGGGPAPVEPANVAGPFTGTVHRYRVDAITLPADHTQFSDDLNGDDRVDNALGFILAGATEEGVANIHVADMLGAGAIDSVVELQSDDPMLRNDQTVGVRFIGAPGDPAGVMGGVIVNGIVTTNRLKATRTAVPSVVRVPVFADADPVRFALAATQLDMKRDGMGGYDATLQGVFEATTESSISLFATALLQGWALHPNHYGSLLLALDRDRNGVIEMSELVSSGLLQNVMTPDVQMFDAKGNWAPNGANTAKNSLSIGISFHLSPCVDDACSRPAAAPTCFDRVRNGDEVGVDCGGACGACPTGTACTADADCQSHCVAGTCAAPTCSDGKNDGVEGGVDCGWGCANACPDKDGCVDDHDCLSGSCNSGVCGPKPAA